MQSEGESIASIDDDAFVTSAFTPSSESSFEPRWSSRNKTSRKLYASNKQSNYHYDKKLISENEVFTSHAHMHKVLAMLTDDIDQQNSDESATLKEAMKSNIWRFAKQTRKLSDLIDYLMN